MQMLIASRISMKGQTNSISSLFNRFSERYPPTKALALINGSVCPAQRRRAQLPTHQLCSCRSCLQSRSVLSRPDFEPARCSRWHLRELRSREYSNLKQLFDTLPSSPVILCP